MINKSGQQARRNREIKYAFQFACSTMYCVLTWVTFRIFFHIGFPNGPMYLISTSFRFVQSGIHAIVLLVFNEDIRQQFKCHILGQKLDKTVSLKISQIVPNARNITKI